MLGGHFAVFGGDDGVQNIGHDKASSQCGTWAKKSSRRCGSRQLSRPEAAAGKATWPPSAELQRHRRAGLVRAGQRCGRQKRSSRALSTRVGRQWRSQLFLASRAQNFLRRQSLCSGAVTASSTRAACGWPRMAHVNQAGMPARSGREAGRLERAQKQAGVQLARQAALQHAAAAAKSSGADTAAAAHSGALAPGLAQAPSRYRRPATPPRTAAGLRWPVAPAARPLRRSCPRGRRAAGCSPRRPAGQNG